MTIPASYSVEVTPSVLTSTGAALALNGICLTTNTRVPIGTVLSFSSGAAVTSFFGSGTNESVIANGGTTVGGNPAGTGYFGGFEGATVTPGELLFAQYPQSAVAAWLHGGNVAAALTLTQLQGVSGSLNITVDGSARAGTINLSSATSFSSAATIIATALNAADPTIASFTASMGASFTGTQSGTNLTTTSVTGLISVGDTVTGTGVAANTKIVSQTSGTPGGAGVYVTSLSGTASAASCTSASNILDVTVDSGVLAVGQLLAGNSVAANTVITALGTGTGGTGTYVVSGSPQNLASGAMTSTDVLVTVTFDSVSGGFFITSGNVGAGSTISFATGGTAATLMLTSATGALISQGAAAAVPATFMNGIVGLTTNWASFFTAFDPDGGSGNTVKLAFAAWTNSVAPRYAYIAWDTDASPAASSPATGSLGYIVNNTDDYSGTIPVYEPSDYNYAAFISGAIASIDFTAINGRTSFAYLTQPGLAASVTTSLAANNLAGNPLAASGIYGNGYNFVGAFATAAQGFVNLQRGTISGPYQWIDSYINQIAISNALQLAAYEYMTVAKSFPYTNAGYANFENALLSTIQQYLNFGAYGPGTLSSAQAVAVNTAAGATIAPTLQSQGWYLQIQPASATTKNSRSSPPINFWYLDNGSVQAVNIDSVSV